MAVIIDATYTEPRAHSLTRQTRYETSLGLALTDIHCAHLHATAHDLDKPLVTVHIVVLQVRVERAIPSTHTHI